MMGFPELPEDPTPAELEAFRWQLDGVIRAWVAGRGPAAGPTPAVEISETIEIIEDDA